MISNICLYNNKLFIPDNGDLETGLIVYSYRQNNTFQNEKFEECFKIKLPVNCRYVKEITLKIVNNLATCLKCILILIFDYEGLRDAFMYSDMFKKKLTHISLPHTFIAQSVQSSNLFITDGPSLLFVSCDKFYFYSIPFNTYNYFKCQYNFSTSKQFKLLQFKHFDLFSQQIAFIVVTADFSSCQVINITTFISSSNNTEIQSEHLPITFFFPQQYQFILKAVNITKFVPSNKLKPFSLNDIGVDESTCVICTKVDCLLFCNGVLKYCCKLTIPMLEIMCINVEFCNASSKNITMILTSENEMVYLFTANENVCEVVKCWHNIKATTIGDVLKKGTKLLLLLKDTDVDSWQKTCILTDIMSCVPVGLLSQNAMPDDCLKTTLTGLEQKIQLGKSAIAQVEHGVSQKAAATIDGLIRLKDFKANREEVQDSNTFRESLVDLILYKDENKSADFSPPELPVRLLDEKRRFIGDHWILCLQFINDSVRNICHPSIKILIKDKQVQSMQKLFICSDDSHSQSLLEEGCSQINPRSKFTILLKFLVSTFQDEAVSFILSWFDGSMADFNNEILISEEEKVLRQHQLFFHRQFRIDDVLNCEIERGISSYEELLFTKSSQHRTVLRISSLYSDISNLKSTILSTSNTNLISLEKFSNCMIFNNEKSCLFGVSIIFNKLSEKMATIEAFTKNESESVLFVHFLYKHLPDDILIVPSLQSEDSQMKKDVISAIKDEVDLLISSLNLHNITDELRKNYSKLMSSHNVGTMTIPKKTYHRIRKALIKREIFSDSILRNFENV